jgi:integrase
MRCLFSLFKKKTGNGLTWYVRFWDNKAREYTVFCSTGILAEGKKERKREAKMKAQEMLKGIRFETEVADRSLVSYLEDFWKSDAPYVKECATIRKKPLSAYYVHQNAVNVSLHIKPCPGLNKITLRNLTAGIIRDWMTWAADKKLSGRTINSALSTMRVAVHYVVDREELGRDTFRNVKEAVDNPKEKGVLQPYERAKLINAETTDPHSRLAILLVLLCGMRRGEVRGLKWDDIMDDHIDLIHNFVNVDGLKKPKRGKTREVPYPAIVEKAFEEVRKVTICPAPDSYVFESIERPGTPMGETFFRNALRRELEGIGI